jgi:hypothetical protein
MILRTIGLEIWWLLWYIVYLGVNPKNDVNVIGCLLGIALKFCLDAACDIFDRIIDNKQYIEFQMVGINVLIFISVFEAIYPLHFDNSFELYTFFVAAAMYGMNQFFIYRHVYRKVQLINY